ncbi:MAG: L,D-transpeptidase family protein [Sulfitobacter sp.]
MAGAIAALIGTAAPLSAQADVMGGVTAFKQAVAEAASRDEDMAQFYRDAGFDPIWTGQSDADRARRAALLDALSRVEHHGLSASRYDVAGLKARLSAVRSPRDRGLAEVEMTKVFLQYARDVQTGMLVPSRVNSAIVREVPYRERASYLAGINGENPAKFLRSLPPSSMEYNALMRRKIAMERLSQQGGWGPAVPVSVLKPGQQGNAVVALRNRLIAMGYLERSSSMIYDAAMQEAVRSFQQAHGLEEDGVAGAGTMEEINKSVEVRLRSVIVAMERERWINQDLGERHIRVNIPDFTAKVIDKGQVTFETRSVVGANREDRPTPEFSDMMDHMVINPSWYVPRSIVTNEYLPALRRNSNAVSHMVITDSRGRRVNRNAVNFSKYTARTFPFSMRQPPSKSNALGLVKFMFPNKYNIYLHDTPAKSLFSRDSRAFSHGCVRLSEPFEFAYALLAKQTDDPEGFFHAKLRTGAEARVNLEQPVPVHLIYRTAFTSPRGDMQYRRDVYGRDRQIWDALAKAGVALGGVQG